VWKWFLGGFIALAALCGGSGFFLVATPQGKGLIERFKPKSAGMLVRLEPVARGDLTKLVSAPGTLEPRTVVKISAQVSAKIIELPFEEGDQVKKGDVVCRLDATDVLAQLEGSRAALLGEQARLEGAKADLAEVTAELGRIRELHDTKDVSQAELDAAEARYQRVVANLKSTEYSIEISRANIVRAEKNVTYTVIESPIDGTITKMDSEVGELVLGTLQNLGTTIMEIGNLSEMLLKAKVDESNVARVDAGQEATIYLNAYPNEKLHGKVERVAVQPTRDPFENITYFETEILVEFKEGLKRLSGARANADIHVESLVNVLKVPSQAVLDRKIDELPKEVVDTNSNVDKNKAYARVVYALENGKTKVLPVTIGSSDLTHTVILGGLDEGEKIVTGPYKILVTLKHEQPATEEGASPTPPGTEKVAGAETEHAKG